MSYEVVIKILASEEQDLRKKIIENYHLKNFDYQILSRSIDARDKRAVYWVYRLKINTAAKLSGKNVVLSKTIPLEIQYPKWMEKMSPVVVGFGPAGMFSALYLARCGANPIIIERGNSIDKRVKDVETFIQEKKLNPNSNIQFGEGGAGAFSDGKLTTNLKNPYILFILEEFYKHGAKEDVLYDHMPHVGTDYLRKIVKNIRKEIESLGGRFFFQTTFIGFEEKESYIVVNAGEYQFSTEHLLLGIGHSAKDTIRYLYQQKNVKMVPKAFSMGVRIEHNAKKISESQYGSFAQYLPKAYYKLAYHLPDRGVYTFCMCPGGYVIASQSEEHTIVTNGMSNCAREGNNSNSAILVDVRPSDYGEDVLAGLAYQEKYEHLAFDISKDYKAPANLVEEFLKNEIASDYRSIQPSYPHGLCFADLHQCLPDYVVDGIQKGIVAFDKKIKGFNDPDALLIGIESRSSSPVRILRDENRKASIPYLYPIGEGAGYAGGITSAALDGLLTAMSIVNKKAND